MITNVSKLKSLNLCKSKIGDIESSHILPHTNIMNVSSIHSTLSHGLVLPVKKKERESERQRETEILCSIHVHLYYCDLFQVCAIFS